MKLSIDWGVSSYYGWGVYGLNLALECAKDGSIELYSEVPLRPDDMVVDPLRKRALVPFIKRSSVDGGKPPGGARLHALGNRPSASGLFSSRRLCLAPASSAPNVTISSLPDRRGTLTFCARPVLITCGLFCRAST